MQLAEALEAARATHHSVLTTLRRDGKPQLSNVLHYVDDEGVIRISTSVDRAKFHNLRREPWAALKVDGEPFGSYAVIEAMSPSPRSRPNRATRPWVSSSTTTVLSTVSTR